jgi:hypothetical protein
MGAKEPGCPILPASFAVRKGLLKCIRSVSPVSCEGAGVPHPSRAFRERVGILTCVRAV